ncbi:MAG: hypothetical protein BGO12_21470 [Verrucomicrobia bacterium 61-8]|nr:MAG: hypothetical protein BGO12_21470 [Verrucomicrobia bacterium 61-8]
MLGRGRLGARTADKLKGIDMANQFLALGAVLALEDGHLRAAAHQQTPSRFDVGREAGGAGAPYFRGDPLRIFFRFPTVSQGHREDLAVLGVVQAHEADVSEDGQFKHGFGGLVG